MWANVPRPIWVAGGRQWTPRQDTGAALAPYGRIFSCGSSCKAEMGNARALSFRAALVCAPALWPTPPLPSPLPLKGARGFELNLPRPREGERSRAMSAATSRAGEGGRAGITARGAIAYGSPTAMREPPPLPNPCRAGKRSTGPFACRPSTLTGARGFELISPSPP